MGKKLKKNKPAAIKGAEADEYLQKRRIRLCLIAVALITFFVFFPSLQNGFTDWDDNEYVTTNQSIRGFTPENIKTIFSSLYIANYQPLTILTYAAEYSFFGLNPVIYHLTNLILHIANSLLVFWFIFLLSGSIRASLLSSLLFAIHPLHVESVAWVAERKDVLSTFFFMLTLIAYLKYLRERKIGFYIISLIMLIISLLSKPMAVTMPAILLLLDFFTNAQNTPPQTPPGARLRKILIEKIPYIIIALIFVIVTYMTQKAYGAVRDYSDIPLIKRMMIPFYGAIFYLIKMILPIFLSAIYPYPQQIETSLLIKLIASTLLFFIIAFLVIKSLKKTKLIAFGFLFYIITILPVLQIIPIGHAIVADRYFYIPSIGIFYIISFYTAKILENPSRKNDNMRTIATYATIAFLIFFAILTLQRCKVWKNGVVLWNDVLSKYPKASLPHNNLGNTYKSQGDIEKALYHYQQAIEIEPTYAMAYYNRATTYNDIGKAEEALKDFNKAIELNPKFSEAYNNRGVFMLSKDKLTEALPDFNKAIELNPKNAQAYNNRATAYLKMKKYDEAFKDYTTALTIMPDLAEVYLYRGNAYAEVDKLDKAIEDYTSAIKFNPSLAIAYHNRAYCYLHTLKPEAAMRDMELMRASGFEMDQILLNDIQNALAVKNRFAK